MKKISFNKKLALRKDTITTLNNVKLNKVMGGGSNAPCSAISICVCIISADCSMIGCSKDCSKEYACNTNDIQCNETVKQCQSILVDTCSGLI